MRFRAIVKKLETVLAARQRGEEKSACVQVYMDFDRRDELFNEHIKTCEARFHFVVPGFDPATLDPRYRTKVHPRFRRKLKNT